MKKKILVVAPYEGLLELFATILPRYSDRIEIETVVGNLEEGLKKARKAEEQGFDAIISRGGTTEMIRAEVSLPVIDIEVSGYDYIRAIKMASNYSGKSALVGFPRITSAANSINELLHTDINIVTVNSSKQVVPALERLRKEGYSLILGDMIAVRVAKEMDFNILLLTSGEESVSNALESTLYICDCVDGYRKQRDLLKQLVETAPETILAYGPGGEPLYQNGQVEALGCLLYTSRCV